MLAKEYQDYILAIIQVAGAQVKAKGKFKTSSVLKHGLTKAAAAKSFARSIEGAARNQKVTAKFINKEIAKMTLSAFKKAHKAAKKQGLVFLPAAAVGAPVIAQAPNILRRDFIAGVGAVTVFGGVMMRPSSAQASAQAGDTAYWGAVKKQVTAFLASAKPAMVKAMT